MLNIWNNPLKYLVFLFMLIINSQVFAEQTHSITFVNNSSESINVAETNERIQCIGNKDTGSYNISPGGSFVFTFTDTNSDGCYYSDKRIQYFISSPNLFKERNSIFWQHTSHSMKWTSNMWFNSSPNFNTWQFKCNDNIQPYASQCTDISGDTFTGTVYINNPIGINPNNITGNILNLANINTYPKVAGTTSNCTFDSTFTNVITSGGNYVLNAQVLQPFGLFNCGMGYQASQYLPESTTPVLGAYTETYSFNNLVSQYTKPMVDNPNIYIINESINTTDQNNFKYNVCINNDYSTNTTYTTKYTYVDNLNKCFIGCRAAGNGFKKAYKINHIFKNNTKTSNLTNTMRFGSNNIYSNPFNLQKLIDMSTKPNNINLVSNTGQCSANIQINISNFNGVLLESMLSAGSYNNQGNPQLSNISCNESTCTATLNFGGVFDGFNSPISYNTFITLDNGNQKVRNFINTSCTPYINMNVSPNYISQVKFAGSRCNGYVTVKTNLPALTSSMISVSGGGNPDLSNISCNNSNGTCSMSINYDMGNNYINFKVNDGVGHSNNATIQAVCNRPM